MYNTINIQKYHLVSETGSSAECVCHRHTLVKALPGNYRFVYSFSFPLPALLHSKWGWGGRVALSSVWNPD